MRREERGKVAVMKGRKEGGGVRKEVKKQDRRRRRVTFELRTKGGKSFIC